VMLNYRRHEIERAASCGHFSRLLADWLELETANERLNGVVGEFAYVENECWDIRCVNEGDGESYYWEIIEHYMAKPHERCIGRGDTIMQAIAEARKTVETKRADPGPEEKDENVS